MRRLAILLAAACAIAALSGCHGARYAYLCSVIDTHVGFAHLTRGENMNTVRALRERVTPADVPVLVKMLDDRDHIHQLAAADVLATLHPDGVRALEAELARLQNEHPPNWGKIDAIEEALRVFAQPRAEP